MAAHWQYSDLWGLIREMPPESSRQIWSQLSLETMIFQVSQEVRQEILQDAPQEVINYVQKLWDAKYPNQKHLGYSNQKHRRKW